MPVTLVPALESYFQAKDAHDIELVMALFTADAHVHDEDQDYNGIAEIRAWTLAGWTKYAYTAEAQSATTTGNNTTVAAKLTGNFPGSPVVLNFDFTFTEDKISNLVIHD